MINLQNKTAIVTGAKQGIGKGIALMLAKAGANVVVADLDIKECQNVCDEITKLGVKSLAIECDVSKKADIDNMISSTAKEFGGLDILVNNAGIYPFISSDKMTEADWDKVIDINLKGTFLCSQAAAAVMAEGGRIIDISSIASVVGFAGLVHYCASKGGVNAMVRALALELASKKITVNAVLPGAIQTPGATGAMDDKVLQQTISAIPMARMGQPEDIAGAVLYLASDLASYVTGQTIVVDGGWTLR
ncbi:SDR family oxidoreductase [Patescibacteria group bacterium]|nr:SDR family oxidoreductase [Patescibacteria group bacterium]